LDTTCPTTTKDDPASRIGTVQSSSSPKKGNSTILKVWFRNGLLIKTEIKPVVTTMNAPSAATSLKSTGIPSLTVSISKARQSNTNAAASTRPPTKPPPGLLCPEKKR